MKEFSINFDVLFSILGMYFLFFISFYLILSAIKITKKAS